MSGSALVRRNLTEFFRELLQKAMQAQDVRTTEDAEFYVVKLLEAVAHPTRRWDDRPLALDFLESFHSPPSHRFGKLKHVGDTALLMAGLFMEAMDRRLVNSDYYATLGRTAYGQLARLESRGTTGHVFSELAERFQDLVRVLAEISFRDLFPGDVHALRVYTRWLYTRSERDALWLIERGLIPVRPPKGPAH
jgi:hypothetical protein